VQGAAPWEGEGSIREPKRLKRKIGGEEGGWSGNPPWNPVPDDHLARKKEGSQDLVGQPVIRKGKWKECCTQTWCLATEGREGKRGRRKGAGGKENKFKYAS